MAQGKCSNPKCGKILTEKNCRLQVFLDGYGYCRDCRTIRDRDYRNTHPDHHKNWYDKHAERYRAYRFKQKLENPKRFLLYSAKARSKSIGVPFNLMLSDIPDIPTHCPVFPWIKIITVVGKGKQDFSPSLDRILPSLGYVKGNVRVVSWRANRLRNDSTMKELEALLVDAKNIQT